MTSLLLLGKSRKPIAVLLPVFALAAFTGSTSQASMILNGSFEIATATITSSFQTAGVADWTNSDIGEALVLPSWFTNGFLFPGPPPVSFAGPVPQTSPDGGNFVFSDGDYHNSPIQQTVNGLTIGDFYALSFYQALAQDTEPGITIPGPVTGQWQVSLGSSTQYGQMMFANGAVTPTATWSPWALQTMTFKATSTSEVLSFFSIGTGDPPLLMLDGISLNNTTPEPSSIALAGLGTLLLGWKLFRHRRALHRAD